MSERVRNVASIAAIAAMAVLLVVLVVSSPAESDRVDQIGSGIKCPVCQGESIANSPAQMARDMMALVEERVAQGVSDAEIVEELLSSYSGAVLLDPPARGSTLLLWLAPLAALAVGMIVIVWWRSHPPARPSAGGETSKTRVLVGGLILAGALAGVVVVAGFLLQDREGPNAGVANLDNEDLSQVSNETMEAVIAANLDNPQINGMRLTLAERYFEAGDYRGAFPHYLAVADSPQSSDAEATSSLIRLGWMAWDGNGAAETAIGLLDQALVIDPASSTALYLKGQVLWCGMADTDGAARLFTKILDEENLPNDSRTLVQADLDAVENGETCT